MKKLHLLGLLAFIFAHTTADAHSLSMHANAISAHNIAALQHSIAMRATQSFSTPYGIQQSRKTTTNNMYTLYGHAPMYGTMPMYGEYNEDGTANIIIGRNGGDNVAPTLTNIWGAWDYSNEDVKFSNFEPLDSNHNLITLGLTGGDSQIMGNTIKWGIITGYIGGETKNHELSIDDTGGHFGAYGMYHAGDFEFNILANGGVLYNDVHSEFDNNEFSNVWAGGIIQTSYNIALDSTFSLRPTLVAGYTWIKSTNYTLADGKRINNDNFNIFELAPGISAIKNIAGDWFGFIDAKYVFNFVNGGDTFINNTKQDELDTAGYSEYRIGLSKSVNALNLNAYIGRHDGGRSGWIGGANVKYIF